MKHQTEKFPAPALEKGLRSLKALIQGGPMNLKELSVETEIPKASLLRIMRTLQQLDMTARDDSDKTFRSLVRIVPFSSKSERARRKIFDSLVHLTGETAKTTEWFVHSRDSMVITERFEPDQPVVQVKARIGFARKLKGELDAVARVALAFLEDTDCSGPFWVYTKGEKSDISTREAQQQIEQVRVRGHALDAEYNSNGIRRYAVPVLHTGSSSLLGIISIAEYFTPGADKHIQTYINELKLTAEDLSVKLSEI